MANLTTEQQFVNIALGFIGSHYVWGGKGLSIFNNGVLSPHKFVNEHNVPLMVFDCSGLVTCCLWLATHGQIDLRATHSAKTMLMTFPIAKSEEDGVLRIYPAHVSISLGRGRVVEAAHGDQTTLTPLDAIARRAFVAARTDERDPKLLLGLRRIPLDKSELITI